MPSESLTTATPNATLAYDAHGNTTVLADQVLGYDVADQHVKTTLADGTVITYLRDATGRVVQRTLDPVLGPDQVVKFSGGSGVSLTLTAGGAELEASVALPGGASLIVTNIDERWSYQNMHGDVIIITDGTGVRQGARASYDPFGSRSTRSRGASERRRPMMRFQTRSVTQTSTMRGSAGSARSTNIRGRSRPSRWALGSTSAH